ncbi:MAG: phage major capsid protein [Nitriliruptorales bacterium]|nr:phage major capsid protein [Nitriliruptorales bacterium]
MSEQLARLRQQRMKVWNDMIAPLAEVQDRSWTAEEQGTWDKGHADLQKYDERIEKLELAERRSDEADRRMEQYGEGRTQRQEESEQLRGFFRHAANTPDSMELKYSAQYRDTLLTTGSGGNLIPTLFRDVLQEHLIQTAAMIDGPRGPTMITTAGGADLQIPKSTVHPTAVIIGENVAITQSDPTFGQVTLGAFKYATAVQVSREMLEDSGVDLEGYLARAMGRAVGNALGDDLVNGAGTTEPRGVLLDAAVGVTGVTAGGLFTAENLIDLQFSVIPPYRRNARWMMADATLGAVRKIREGAGTGQFLFQPSLVSGTPGTLLGDPVVIDPFMPVVGSSAESIAYGDFSQYYVRTVDGVVVARSDDFAFLTDLTTFKVLYRADGALIDLTGAVKTFVGAV